MDPLAGWTVAVTAERRAREQVELLQRRDATVLLVPTVRAERVDDATLRSTTAALIERPPDLWVASSAAAVQGWIASAWSWGLGPSVIRTLSGATVLARGASTAGALIGEGLEVDWQAATDTLSGLLDRLTERGVTGQRVAVLLHGSDMTWFADALRQLGAEVTEVPVYRLSAAKPEVGEPDPGLTRLRDAAALRELDAITFTSQAAARNLALRGGPELLDRLAAAGVICACVGPLTARAALDGGLPGVVVAEPSRLGSMIGLLAEHLGRRGREFEMAGLPVRLQGARLAIDGRQVRLTPRERTLLEAMAAAGGAVMSKRTLSQLAWATAVSEHTVEVTVNRLRAKLGPAAVALETSNRRGYRLAVAG
ncbi:MAG TPA: uroporphyrinogen-III synthase [Acidimicrobiia bacterium]|nr:uroporphyrinogen-III synthase [Acidimicrobiia bacterium]